MSTLVLPGRPGLASLAGQGLSKVATGAAEGLFQGLAKKREEANRQKLFDSIYGNRAQAARTNDLANLEPRQAESGMRRPDPRALSLLASSENVEDRRLAESIVEQEKMASKERAESQKQHFEIAKDTLKSAASQAESLPQKEIALESMKDAIKNRNLGFFSRDNLAEITGIEGLRSSEGAVFKTAGKEFFIGNLGRVGARGLNQWLERQISDMMPKLGRSTEANLIVSEALNTELDVSRKQIELTEQIADRQEKEFGGPRRNLSSEVMKELRPYAIEKQKELQSKIRDIQEKYEPVNKEGLLMRDPAGNLRRVSSKDVKAAKSAGYKQEK